MNLFEELQSDSWDASIGKWVTICHFVGLMEAETGEGPSGTEISMHDTSRCLDSTKEPS